MIRQYNGSFVVCGSSLIHANKYLFTSLLVRIYDGLVDSFIEHVACFCCFRMTWKLTKPRTSSWTRRSTSWPDCGRIAQNRRNHLWWRWEWSTVTWFHTSRCVTCKRLASLVNLVNLSCYYLITCVIRSPVVWKAEVKKNEGFHRFL